MQSNKDYSCKFISFEGCDGSGKTTQAQMLSETLKKLGISSISTREPGGSELGEEIRSVLSKEQDPITEFLLVLAGRYDHVKKIIQPSLEQGKWVICDRFLDSTICYQGILKGLGLDYIQSLHAKVIGNITPDVTFILDLPSELVPLRVKGRARGYDTMSTGDHEKVRKGFLQIAAMFPSRICVLDATLDANEVHRLVLERLSLPSAQMHCID